MYLCIISLQLISLLIESFPSTKVASQMWWSKPENSMPEPATRDTVSSVIFLPLQSISQATTDPWYYTKPEYLPASPSPPDNVISTTLCGRSILFLKSDDLAKLLNSPIRRPILPLSGWFSESSLRCPTTTAAMANATAAAAATSMSQEKARDSSEEDEDDDDASVE